MLTACSLCPRECGVNRLNGEKGFCNLGDVMVIQQALPHFGEEPPLSGVRGAGTIFFLPAISNASIARIIRSVTLGSAGRRARATVPE